VGKRPRWWTVFVVGNARHVTAHVIRRLTTFASAE